MRSGPPRGYVPGPKIKKRGSSVNLKIKKKNTLRAKAPDPNSKKERRDVRKNIDGEMRNVIIGCLKVEKWRTSSVTPYA